MNEQELKRELERLSQRLARIENRLGLDAPAAPPAYPAPPVHPPPPAPGPPPVKTPPLATPLAPPVAAAPVSGSSAPPTAPTTAPPAKAATFAGMARREPIAAPPRVPGVPAPPRGAGKSAMSWEMIIGGRLAAWVGALVVVIAAAYFAQLFWKDMTPIVRCLIMTGFAALLMGAGEWALRSVGRAASAGLFSAGLGVAYLTALATFHSFHLVSESGAFALLCLVAVIGIAVTWRTRFLTIGVLSIVGGYLSPVLLQGVAAFPGALAMYLTMLLAIALALSAFMPRPFRPLRYVALAGQGIVGIWAIEAGSMSDLAGLFFITLWWGMVQAESVFAAMRRQSALGNSIASLLTTAWYVIFGCQLLASAGPAWWDWAGVFAISVSLASAAIAATFGPGVEGLRQIPRQAIDKLAVALWCSAGVLLAAGIALQFDGYGRAVAWLAVALGSIEAGRRLRSRGIDIFGLIVGAIAIAQVFLLDSWIGRLSRELVTLGADDGVRITGWSILALVAIAAVHAAARRLRIDGSSAWRTMVVILSIVGTLMWVGLCANQGRGLAVTGGWLLGVAALLAAQRFGRVQRYFEIALVLLVATAGRWLIVDSALRRISPTWNADAYLPVLNVQMAMAVLIAMCGWWASALMRQRAADEVESPDETPPTFGRIGEAVIVVVAVLVLIGLSFEVDRLVMRAAAGAAGIAFGWPTGHVRQLLLTLLWATGAAAIGLLGISWRRAGASWAGQGARPGSLLVRTAWVWLAMCVVKWMFGDTILWTFKAAAGVTHWPVLNLQMFVGAALTGVGALLYLAGGGAALAAESDSARRWAAPARWLPVVGAVVVLWGLSFEVDRAISQWELSRPKGWVAVWPAMQLRLLWWTALWAAGGWAMTLPGALRRRGEWISGGFVILSLAAVAWLSIDTLSWRVVDGPVPCSTVLNLQFAVGAAIAVMLAIALALHRRVVGAPGTLREEGAFLSNAGALGLTLIAAIGLWLGSLEIDRFMMPGAPGAGSGASADAAVARQTALSVYWGLYAIVMIAAGFVWRSTLARYAGLGLLAITLAKVFIVDMAGVATVYRVLSMAVVGLLLIATSVGYWKLAPRLTGAAAEEESDHGEGIHHRGTEDTEEE